MKKTSKYFAKTEPAHEVFNNKCEEWYCQLI